MPSREPYQTADGVIVIEDPRVSQFGTDEPNPAAWAEPQRFPLPLDLAQWDLAIDALQQVADEVGGQEQSDLAVLLRNEIDRLVPGTYGGCQEVTMPDPTETPAPRCMVKIRYGTTLHTQCDKPEDHWDLRIGLNDPHEGPGLPEFPSQRIVWQPGDRREYVGEWPGDCTLGPCVLHAGHHGRCAP